MKYDLRHGDCLELMNDIPDGSVDAIICDLPFGTTQNKWDAVIPFDTLWMQYNRITKDNAAIVLFAQIPFSIMLGASNIRQLKYEWIWEKDKATGFLNANKSPLKAHENILVFYSKPPTYNPQKTFGHKPTNNAGNKLKNTTNYGSYEHLKEKGQTDRFPRTVQNFNVVNSQHGVLHPTQKPIELMEYLIKTYTNGSETVLDNCMGSGTTGVACKRLNRKFIGIEKEAKYFEIATKRIQETIEGAGCTVMAAIADKGSVGKKNLLF